MRSSIRLVLAAPFVVLAGGCAGATAGGSAGAPAVPLAVIAEQPIQNVAPGWAVGGTARLNALQGTSDMQLEVSVDGLTPGPHAWHVHVGGCGNPGAVVVPFTTIGGQPGLGQPLVASETGEATGEGRIPAARLTRQQIESGEFSLHIHNHDGPNPGRSIACADL